MVGTDNAATSGGTANAGAGTHFDETVAIADFAFPTANGNGRMVAPAANDCLITLDSDVGIAGGGLAGTTVKLTAVTSTLWYAEVMLFSTTARCTGADVFSDPT